MKLDIILLKIGRSGVFKDFVKEIGVVLSMVLDSQPPFTKRTNNPIEKLDE